MKPSHVISTKETFGNVTIYHFLCGGCHKFADVETDQRAFGARAEKEFIKMHEKCKGGQ